MASNMIQSIFTRVITTWEMSIGITMMHQVLVPRTIWESEYLYLLVNLAIRHPCKLKIFSSIIITGCSPWTVYEFDNYQGSSVCFHPLSSVDCTPGFYDTPAVLGGISRKMSSTAKGCFAETKLYPKPVPEGVVQKFQPNH